MKRCLSAVAAIAAILFYLSPAAHAANPAGGTLTDTSAPVEYDAGPFPVSNQTGFVSSPVCNNPAFPCDNFALTVTLPAGFANAHPNDFIRFTISWTDAGAGASDYDLYVFNGTVTTTDGSEQARTQSATSKQPEVATLGVCELTTDTLTVVIVPFTSTGETVHGKIELVPGDPPTNGAGCPGSGAQTFGGPDQAKPGVPRYQNFAPPADSAANNNLRLWRR